MIAALIPPLGAAFRAPVLGRIARPLITAPTTRSMYDSPARQFVARHRAAGGRAYRYRLTWRPDDNACGAAHLTDLPLLLGTRQAWKDAAILGETEWAEVDRRGRAIRRIWAEFARTGALSHTEANDTITFRLD
ncbi:hypothetical protein MPUL_37730 [Mycolicibacterium pulveris]|uniref:Carboxylesterase n=1 Tax=Mycolicibacterium pulveris TaxID=36813 RepID=A0A7I7UMJ2_MYCPV|nr:hypothetical protein MPUL_37730 [Mycolicibacterium pulveris]